MNGLRMLCRVSFGAGFALFILPAPEKRGSGARRRTAWQGGASALRSSPALTSEKRVTYTDLVDQNCKIIMLLDVNLHRL